MDIFVDRKPIHNSNNHSHSTGTSSGYHSLNNSFSSNAESGVSWEPDIATPGSTPRASSGLVKTEDAFLSASFYNPDAYGVAPGYCPMSVLTQDMMSEFQNAAIGTGYLGNSKSSQEQTIMDFQSLSNYTGPLGDISCNGLPSQTPSLDHDLSSPISGDGSSPVSTNFVVPSQTFLDGFELQSPMRPSALHFNLQYDDPESEYTADFSLGSSSPGSMTCHGGSMSYMMPHCNDIKSSSFSTTPTRPSTLRPPKLEQLPSPAALHRAQSQLDAEKHAKVQMARVEKRRIKRELRESILPNNWRVQNKPKKFCTWPGCNGKFQRQEHLKRHEKTHRGEEIYPCPFCPLKKFNRTDNLKQHVWLHTLQGKKSSRTPYHPDALAYYQELCRKGSKPRRANNPDIIKEERGLPVRTSASTRARVSNHDVRMKEE